jgi:hypothetical protein
MTMQRFTVLMDKIWRFGYGALGSTYYQDTIGEVEVPHPGVAGRVYTTTEDGIEWADASAGGHWEPVTNGDADSPEIVFGDGDVVMTFMED